MSTFFTSIANDVITWRYTVESKRGCVVSKNGEQLAQRIWKRNALQPHDSAGTASAS